MNDDEMMDMMQEMIELQRYKSLNEEKENRERLDVCRDLFNQIMRELDVEVQTITNMDAYNLGVILSNIRAYKAKKS